MSRSVSVRSRDGFAAWMRGSVLFAIAMALVPLAPASAQLYINEIFWDAGGDSEGGMHLAGSDNRDEYIELRGPSGFSLANHYLVFVEGEDTSGQTGDTGQIDGFFDLGIAFEGGAASIGSNGFLMIRQKGNLYDGLHGGVAAGTTNLVNAGVGTDSAGWGNNFKTAGSSTVGFSWAPDPEDLTSNQIENGSFTAFLIDRGTGPAPTVGMMLDGLVNNDGNAATPHDGLDHPDGQEGWSILDSIGIHTEALEAVYGRTYSQVTYGTIVEGEQIGPGIFFTPRKEPGSVYVGVDWPEREIEYAGRWGNSTGSGAEDWHVSNVTQRSVAGALTGAPDYRQSGDPHPACYGCALPSNFEIESNKNVAYGTPLLDTLGDPNLGYVAPEDLFGDYNGNDVIDAADYTVWRDAMIAASTTLLNDPTPGTVDESDFLYWRDHFGDVLEGGAGSGSAAVPEPASLLLVAIAGGSLVCVGRRQRPLVAGRRAR